MGGGKGSIDHYVTPVRPGRIVIELAGYCEFEEVRPFLHQAAHLLPFPAEAISHDMLEAEAEEQHRVERDNKNPFDFKYCLENNMLGSKFWAGKYDYEWWGKYR